MAFPIFAAMDYTGKERDTETGLDYYGARYFSGVMGRWTSPDWSIVPQPIPYANLEFPQTLNLYSYVQNNPLRYVDPEGHLGCGFLWLSSCPESESQSTPPNSQLTTAGVPIGPSAENRAAADQNPARLVVSFSNGGDRGGEIHCSLSKPSDDTTSYAIVQAETNISRSATDGERTTDFGPGTSQSPKPDYFEDIIWAGIFRAANNSIQTFYMVPLDARGKPAGLPKPVNVVDKSGNVFYGLGVYFSRGGQAFVNSRFVPSNTFVPPR